MFHSIHEGAASQGHKHAWWVWMSARSHHEVIDEPYFTTSLYTTI